MSFFYLWLYQYQHFSYSLTVCLPAYMYKHNFLMPHSAYVIYTILYVYSNAHQVYFTKCAGEAYSRILSWNFQTVYGV
jgi:hypothetical protein